jgi:hypothetical protein
MSYSLQRIAVAGLICLCAVCRATLKPNETTMSTGARRVTGRAGRSTRIAHLQKLNLTKPAQGVRNLCISGLRSWTQCRLRCVTSGVVDRWWPGYRIALLSARVKLTTQHLPRRQRARWRFLECWCIDYRWDGHCRGVCKISGNLRKREKVVRGPSHTAKSEIKQNKKWKMEKKISRARHQPGCVCLQGFIGSSDLDALRFFGVDSVSGGLGLPTHTPWPPTDFQNDTRENLREIPWANGEWLARNEENISIWLMALEPGAHRMHQTYNILVYCGLAMALVRYM